MRPSDRRALRERHRFRCGYCGTSEVDAGGELTVDHFQPQAAGGTDRPENWVYACIICNDYKGQYWQPHSANRILHPERDLLAEHIREGEDGRLVSLTQTGRFHIARLRLNRPQLIIQRRRKRDLQILHQRLTQLEEDNTVMRDEMQAMREQIDSLLTQIKWFIEGRTS
jgi:hypothetical protein